MRRLLLLLLIALLPLRALAGEAMVVAMAAGQLGEAVAERTDDMSADCPMRVQGGADTAMNADAGQPAPGCESCNLCLSFGQGPQLVFPFASLAVLAAPVIPDRPFFSADTHRLLRPPIA